MSGIGRYFSELSERFGAAWNRFWFEPSDPGLVSLLRILTGLAALGYVFSYTADLVVWFADDGMLPVETVRELTGAASREGPAVFHWSYLYWFDEPALLWAVHVLGLLALAAFTLGLFTRLTSVLALIVVLAYVHRGPMITGPWEPVLTMMLLYLCIAPCGARFSVDAWRRTAREGRADGNTPSLAANISVRLMQVHLTAFYLMMGLTKLAGITWWSGEAVWWLIAHPESRLLDLTFLHQSLPLINLWTYAIVVFELSFAVLIWNHLARPLLLAAGVLLWGSLVLITGLTGFCLTMLIANLCFVPPEALDRGLEAFFRRPRPLTLGE